MFHQISLYTILYLYMSILYIGIKLHQISLKSYIQTPSHQTKTHPRYGNPPFLYLDSKVGDTERSGDGPGDPRTSADVLYEVGPYLEDHPNAILGHLEGEQPDP